jgi:hypothetical protein
MTKRSPAPHGAGRKRPVKAEPQESASVKPCAERPARPVRAGLARHRRRCKVCASTNREAIEQDFLRWRSPEKLARDYDIADHSSIYRHVHATGLYTRRRQSIRAALETILERSDQAHPSDFDVVRAASAYAHMDGSGQWVDPPTQFIFKLIEGSGVSPDLLRPGASRLKQPQSNSRPAGLKNDATH